MTPENVRDLILAFLGNAVLIGAIAYWIKSRADIQITEAKRRYDETMKRYDLKIKQLEAQQAKVASDERQEDKLTSLPGELASLLKSSLDSNRDLGKELQDLRERLEQIEETRAEDYLMTQERDTQARATVNKSIFDIRQEVKDWLADLRKNFKEDLSAGFTDAITRNQTQSAIRDIFTTFNLGFRFPDESDPRWKWCIIRFSHTEQMNVYKVPKFIDDNFVTTIKSGEQVWIISDRYSGLDDWGFIRPYNDPHLHGYIQMHGLAFDDCRILKRTDKTPPEGLPPITAVVPAPG